MGQPLVDDGFHANLPGTPMDLCFQQVDHAHMARFLSQVGV